MDLNGKNVLIVGAHGGVGEHLCGLASIAGARVWDWGRRAEVAVGCSEYTQLDLENFTEIDAAAAQLPDRLDVVIVASGFLHNADISPEKKLGDITPEALIKNYSLNAMAPLLVARAVLPKFARDAVGVFAVLSARVGSISDNKLGGWYSYRMSKTALNMGLKNLSIELARTHKHLTVLGLHPGTVDTRLSAPFKGNVTPAKLFTPEQSAAYLWDVIAARGPADSGKVFDWNNTEIPA